MAHGMEWRIFSTYIYCSVLLTDDIPNKIVDFIIFFTLFRLLGSWDKGNYLTEGGEHGTLFHREQGVWTGRHKREGSEF